MSEEKYNALKSYLNNKLESFPDDSEIDDIINIAIKQDAWESNKGISFDRVEHNIREKAFYDQWMKDNEPKLYLNYGHGVLQDLFIKSKSLFGFDREWLLEINNRDRLIAATVIQWLGSNCGMCFLSEALKRFNAGILEGKINQTIVK